VLARVVRGPVGDTCETRDRSNVDDRAAAGREHGPAELPAEQERPSEVHLDHVTPLSQCRLLERLDQGDSGVVDKHVDPTELIKHVACEPAYLGLVSDIRGGTQRRVQS
jgi:hypothetical protein